MKVLLMRILNRLACWHSRFICHLRGLGSWFSPELELLLVWSFTCSPVSSHMPKTCKCLRYFKLPPVVCLCVGVCVYVHRSPGARVFPCLTLINIWIWMCEYKILPNKGCWPVLKWSLQHPCCQPSHREKTPAKRKTICTKSMFMEAKRNGNWTMFSAVMLHTKKSNEYRVTPTDLVWKQASSYNPCKHNPCKQQLYKWGIDAVKLLRSLLMLSVPRQQGGR